MNNKHAELASLIRALARELGHGWSVATEGFEHGTHLQGPDGLRLFVRDADAYTHRAGQRVTIRTTTPEFVPHTLTREVADRPPAAITAATERGAAAIAADIRRRLLPQASAWTSEVRGKLDAFTTERGARHASRDALAQALPAGARADRESDSATRSEVSFYNGTSGLGSFQLNHDGSEVHIDARSVPFATALEIAQVLSRASS